MIPVKLIVLTLLTAAALFADGFIIFPPPNITPLSVKFHKVTCNIDNGIAKTTVDQIFVNNQEKAVTSGRYVFPVPLGAAIDQFNVIVDGVPKTATVMDKDEARKFFIEAIKNSNQASLLEYTNNSAYSLEIGNIAPGAFRRLQLSYIEVLPKTDGLSRYLYPLNTEKFSVQLIDTVSITVNITNTTPITSVYSPSFPVAVQRTDEKNVTATYISTKTRPNRDFDLYYKLSNDDVSFHLFTHKEVNKDGYFLMLLTPKLIKPAEGDPVVAKDIVFTIDKSGSMFGVKISQACDALKFCINRLLPDDYFNIVTFQSTLSSNADQLLAATAENIGSTREFVDAIRARGGTNIAEALTTSLSRMVSAERPHYCIFLTDGRPTSGVTDIATISQMVKEANTSGTRIFSVGFGFDVNTILLDKISIDNGGYPLYCNPEQNIEEVISDLYKKIETPLLTSPTLSFDGAVSLSSISPEKLPDLFSGSEIAVYGRYHGQGTNTVTLSGNNGKEVVSLKYSAEFPASNDIYPFLPRLWATQQIAGLMIQIKMQALTKESSTSLVDSIKKLSMEYGIVTPYTSSLFIKGGTPTVVVEGLKKKSGSSANDASNYMQRLQQNSNSAQTVVADTNSLSYIVAPQVNQVQNVGNKIFVYTSDSLWRDVAYDSVGTSTADTVLYGSEKYFTLAENNSELRELMTVGSQTMFNYNGQNYVVLNRSTTAIMPPKIKLNMHVVPQKLVITVKKSSVSISRRRSELPGIVKIYSVNGRYISHLSFKKTITTIHLAKRDYPGSGTYLLVYQERGEELIKRIVLK